MASIFDSLTAKNLSASNVLVTGGSISAASISAGTITSGGISAAFFRATSSAAEGQFIATNGESSGLPWKIAQMRFGWNNTDQFNNYIVTQHVGSATAGNQFRFYTSNGVAAGTLTSAVLGFVIDGGSISSGGGISGGTISGTNLLVGAATAQSIVSRTSISAFTGLSAATMTINRFLTTDSVVRIGSLEIQPYALNNAWIGENVYYDATNFKYRAAGAAGLFYFQGNEGQLRFAPTSSAAGNMLGTFIQLKVNAFGGVAMGGMINNLPGNYTGAVMVIVASASISGVGIGTILPDQRLSVSGNANVTGTLSATTLLAGNITGSNVFSSGGITGNSVSTGPLTASLITVSTTSVFSGTYNVGSALLNFVSGTVTASMPSPVGRSGSTFTFKTTGTCSATLSATVGLIDNQTTQVITTPFVSLTVASDNTNWYIL